MGNTESEPDTGMSCDMCRKNEGGKTRVVKNPGAKSQQAGIGAVFSINKDNKVVFCAAAAGDTLVAIGGVEIGNRSVHDIASRLLGPPGSLVLVRFRRKERSVYVENTIAMDRRPMQLDAIRKVAESIQSPPKSGEDTNR